MKRCTNCGEVNDSMEIELNWDAVCLHCGHLTWIKPGQLRLVRIRRLSEFGVHVDVGGGILGMIHNSELSATRIEHPSELVQVDDVLTAMVLRVDLDERRIGLSVRRVARDELEDRD